MEKIMVLAGSRWQIPLIEKIKEKGYTAIDVNPYEDSPAFPYADKYALLDILDTKSCLDYARNESVDAVMSEQCDIANPSVAYISEQLGLKTIGCGQAELFTNKLKMRLFGKEHGLPTPEFEICFSVEEAIAFYNNLGRKMVIKPLDSNSSRGVFLIDSMDELVKKFDATLGFSKIQKAVLCERYIEGEEFTVDGLKTGEGHISLAVSEKRHYKHNPNIACTLFFSHKSDQYDYGALKQVNDDFVNMTGLPFGLTHAEYKYENGVFYLIEIGARGGGNLIGSHIVPLMSGIDTYTYLIEKTLGHRVMEKYQVNKNLESRCAVLQFFDVPGGGGRVKDIRGLDFLEKNPNVVDFALNFKIGDEIHDAENDSGRIGYYIAYGEDRGSLEELMSEIKEKFRIYVVQQA